MLMLRLNPDSTPHNLLGSLYRNVQFFCINRQRLPTKTADKGLKKRSWDRLFLRLHRAVEGLTGRRSGIMKYLQAGAVVPRCQTLPRATRARGALQTANTVRRRRETDVPSAAFVTGDGEPRAQACAREGIGCARVSVAVVILVAIDSRGLAGL